jgi:hypothetical protein
VAVRAGVTKAARSATAEQRAGAGKRKRAPARADTTPRAAAAAGDAVVQHHEIQNKAMPGASTGTLPGRPPLGSPIPALAAFHPAHQP